ncbi:carbohydrate binding family 6 [Colletotrichum musicola]|uniref:Carbohydrate binding family 6 n=1 Tax=Colletotrichum musicola TaxID=2175873 RepID=A0A8H6JTT6_9PEZI|nr:carbohydrate binding family 6 [Colletotrichum musicola]
MKGFVRSSAALLSALPLLQATGVPQIPGYEVTWSDDFASQRHSRPDPDKWIIDTGTGYPGGPPAWGTWEIQTYTDSPRNIHVSEDGNLQITALRDVQGGWTSSRIETKRGDFMAQPGGKMRIQARLKIPDLVGEGHGLGYWSAFWSLGSEFRGNYWNWPGVGEFDIMENVNTLDRVWGVLHCDKNPGGECDESNGLGDYRSCPGSPCPGNFHTYAIEVDRSTTPETLTWLVDDIAYHEIPEWWLSESVWQQTVHVPHFVLLNLAIGGGFPDGVAGFETPTNATLSGGTYEAEYVAVYNSV